MFAQDVFKRLGLSQDTDLLNDLQKEALLEPTEAAQSPYMDDPAYAGFETLRGLFGSNHGDNPSMYWLAQGEEMPEFATVADAQAAVFKSCCAASSSFSNNCCWYIISASISYTSSTFS